MTNYKKRGAVVLSEVTRIPVSATILLSLFAKNMGAGSLVDAGDTQACLHSQVTDFATILFVSSNGSVPVLARIV